MRVSCSCMQMIYSLIGSLVLSILSAQAADLWLDDRIAVFGSFAGLRYSLNPGIAWGIRLPAGIQEVLIVVALIVVAYMAIQQSRRPTPDALPLIAFGMILGGGLANVIDRFLDGYVTDYVQIGTFPIFNVADSFVTIGVSLLLLESLKRGKG